MEDGVCPSNSNQKAIGECALPQIYTEVSFLSLVGHYRRFTKGFACIAQPLSKYLIGEGASKKSEQVSLTEDAMKAFKVLKQACMTAPILVFTDYTKLFLLQTDASKDRLEVLLLQKQADGQYHPIAYGSRAMMPHARKIITPPNSGFWHDKVGSYRALYRSTCPTSHFWCGQIIIHSHT